MICYELIGGFESRPYHRGRSIDFFRNASRYLIKVFLNGEISGNLDNVHRTRPCRECAGYLWMSMKMGRTLDYVLGTYMVERNADKRILSTVIFSIENSNQLHFNFMKSLMQG